MSKIWFIYNKYFTNEKLKSYPFKMLLKESFHENFGNDLEMININNIVCSISSNKLSVTDKDGNELKLPKIVFFNLNNHKSMKEIDRAILLAKYLETAGCHVIDSAMGLFYSEDKFLQIAMLRKAGLPVPKTVCGVNANIEDVIRHKDVDDIFLVKSRGWRGRNVFLSRSKNEVQGISGFLNQSTTYLFQEYIKYSHGKSLRVEIIGKKHYRTRIFEAQDNKFQSNLSLGGQFRDVTGQFPEVEELGLKASNCFNLDIAGVDLLFQKDGSFVICEVNNNPGLSVYDNEIDKITIGKIIDMLKSKLEIYG